MKSKIYLPIAILSLAGLIMLPGCGGKGSDPSPADEVKAILISGTWALQTVLVDGVDQSTVYTGLTVRFTETNYTSSNGRVVWPASGTWQFVDNTGKSMVRNDGLVIEIEESNNSKLVLKLIWDKTTLGAGRTTSVKGAHVFTFGK